MACVFFWPSVINVEKCIGFLVSKNVDLLKKFDLWVEKMSHGI